MKRIFLFVAALLVALTAAARPVLLVSHHQRSSSGTLSTLVWKDCGPVGTGPGGTFVAPCIDPNNAWVVANGVTGSSVTWDWDPDNLLLTATGVYTTATHISSNPSGSSVLADRVTNLQVDLVNGVTNATAYNCIEGNFVATVGASACGNYRFGVNFADDSTRAYNVGGDPYCVVRTLGGDDTVIGPTRGVRDSPGSAGCSQTAAAFEQYSLVEDTLDSGGQLVVSNGVCLGSGATDANCANANYMTFELVPGPGAVRDSAGTYSGTPVTIDVLANDIGFASPVTVTISNPPTNGSALVTGSPGDPSAIRIVYTPGSAFVGTDTFRYDVTDGTLTSSAIVTVTVAARTPQYFPSGPQVNVPVSTVTNGEWKQCYVAGMGTDIGSNAENVLSVCHGTYLMMAGRLAGSNTLMVLAAATRADAIQNTGGSSTHVANGSRWYFAPNWSWGFTSVNDSVILSTCDVSASSPTSMCLHTGGGGYRINDLTNLFDSTYEKIFFVESLPGAYNDTASTPRSVPVRINILANDVGFNNPVTATISTAPQNGTVDITGSPGDRLGVYATYTPAAGFTGTETFQYTVTDGVRTGTATVTVTVIAPQANADAALTAFSTPISVSVMANDVGFVDPVTVALTSSPSHGTAVVTGSPGNAGAIRVVYTPAAGFIGTDTVQYQVSDGYNSASATVTITVAAYKAVDDEYNVLYYDSPALFVAQNDIGFQGTVTLTILTFPTYGSAHTHNSPGSQSDVYIHYFAPGNPGVTDTMTYQLSDGVRTSTATVTIHTVAFIAENDFATIGGGNPVTIYVTQNDLGFNYPRTVDVFTNPQHGIAVAYNYPYCCSDPYFVYTPEPGFFGDDTFQYAVDDGSKIGIATVTVHVVNDADNDLVDDRTDNCVGVANANQLDTDGDRYGNMCDADFNNDGHVNFADLAIFRARFGGSDPDADMDGSGLVNFADLGRLKALFGKPPGPSGLAP